MYVPGNGNSGVSGVGAGAIPVRTHHGKVTDLPSIPPSYQDHIQAHTHTLDSGRTYSVYPGIRGGSGGNPVLDSNRVPPPLPPRNPVPPSYGEHVGGNPVKLSNPVLPSNGEYVNGTFIPQGNPVPPSYGEHVGGNPVPQSNLVPPSYGQHVGGNPVPGSNPVPPSYEEYISGNDNGNGVPGAAVAQADASDNNGAVKVESRRNKWVMFVAGNLISAAVVISEIAQLNICFDEHLGDDDDITSSADLEAEIAQNASYAHGVMMFTLVFGLWVEVFSASTLSLIYRSPLDIKSVHKIPSDDMRTCGASVIVHFLAPFSWAMIYLFGGLASIYFSGNSSCGGQGGSGVEFYLLFTGVVMVFGGVFLVALSMVLLFFSCGSPTRCTDGCCATIRRRINKTVLAKGPYLDVFWQLQGSVWSYRTGGFSLLAFVLVSASGVFGEILAACGSLAPDIVQELAGPLG